MARVAALKAVKGALGWAAEEEQAMTCLKSRENQCEEEQLARQCEEEELERASHREESHASSRLARIEWRFQLALPSEQQRLRPCLCVVVHAAMVEAT